MKKLIYIIIIGILATVAYYSFQQAKADIYGSSLVGWWRFDTNDDLNGVTLDRSESGNNGKLKNIATSTFYSIGKIGQGFNFDGTNDYVDIGDIFYSDVFTVCAWIKIDALAGATQKNIVVKRNSSGGTSGTFEWELSVQNDSFSFDSQNTSAGYALSLAGPTDITANQWYHVCAVQKGNGNTGSLYFNGVENDTGLQTSAMRDSASLIQVAVRSNGINARYWDGHIDDVRIYNRALSAEEVAQLYNMGMTQFHSFSDF